MLPLLSSLAVTLQPAAAWVEFDRRGSGWGDSPYEYDAASLRREGNRLRVTYRYTFFTSGVPDYHYRIRLEVDCIRRRARAAGIRQSGGGIPPRFLATPTISRPFASDSIEAALARRLCPEYGSPAS